ncbi:MAG TPA: cytochrome-c peroxidase, partial [Halieaceae bacterium]|nr:cytochrome-c peroxidase [Halieaceae bacterium]
MKIGKLILALLVLAVAFGGGLWYGKQQSTTIIAANDAGGSYGGGFRSAEPDAKPRATAARGPGGTVHQVREGQAIQDAVNAAEPGDTIRIFPGTYTETVYIDKDGIRLIGVIEQGNWPTLEGEKRLNDAILYSGNDIVVENLKITNYKGNGIMGQAGNNFEIRNNLIIDTGVYGIFPQLGQNGIVEDNVVSGIEDAAIYVGMSDNIHVAGNEVFDSVAGIEIENSRHAIVENNYVHHNTGGVLAFITPGLPIKTTYDVIIRDNFIVDNNTPNFGAPGSTVAGIPAGTGVLIMAADEVVIENNIIRDHQTAGILVVDHANASNITADPDADPAP